MQSIVSPYLIKFNRYVRSVLLFIILVLFCTAFEREIMHTLRVLAVWVFLAYLQTFVWFFCRYLPAHLFRNFSLILKTKKGWREVRKMVGQCTDWQMA